MKNEHNFTTATFKYRGFCYDVYNSTNIEYPCEKTSSINNFGDWCLRDYQGNLLAKVSPKGKVTL